MIKLLDILVDNPIINDNDIVIVKVTINYQGNTFQALGTSCYGRDYFDFPSDLDHAIREAQDEAIEKAKKLAGI